MVKDVFQGDCQLTPPCGINPQSNTIIFSDGSSQNLSGSLFKIQFLFFSTFQCGRYNVLNFFFDHQKLKKTPSKVAQNSSNPLFFPYCQHSPNGPNRRIHVPKCGLLTNCIQNWDHYRRVAKNILPYRFTVILVVSNV